MAKDISLILDGWPFEPGKISVRRIVGRDGRPNIQLRLDMGLLQMEVDGRPDGARPHGCDSLLHYHRDRLARWRRRHGGDDGFTLDGEDCERLRAEATMYYHRYISEFALGDYAAVLRDTERNLEVLDLCARYADTEADRAAMEQHRSYVLMMHTRSRAMQSLEKDEFAEARQAVEEGLEQLREHALKHGRPEIMEDGGEATVLKLLLEEISLREPADAVTTLEAALAQAVADERYEEAARIRDKLRGLGQG